VRGAVSAKAHVRLMVRSHGHWRVLRRKPLQAGGTFAASLRPGHGHRMLRIRAVIKGVGRSNVVRVTVRR
jgi:hypothetical protein